MYYTRQYYYPSSIIKYKPIIEGKSIFTTNEYNKPIYKDLWNAGVSVFNIEHLVAVNNTK